MPPSGIRRRIHQPGCRKEGAGPGGEGYCPSPTKVCRMETRAGVVSPIGVLERRPAGAGGGAAHPPDALVGPRSPMKLRRMARPSSGTRQDSAGLQAINTPCWCRAQGMWIWGGKCCVSPTRQWLRSTAAGRRRMTHASVRCFCHQRLGSPGRSVSAGLRLDFPVACPGGVVIICLPLCRLRTDQVASGDAENNRRLAAVDP